MPQISLFFVQNLYLTHIQSTLILIIIVYTRHLGLSNDIRIISHYFNSREIGSEIKV